MTRFERLPSGAIIRPAAVVAVRVEPTTIGTVGYHVVFTLSSGTPITADTFRSREEAEAWAQGWCSGVPELDLSFAVEQARQTVNLRPAFDAMLEEQARR